MVNLPFSDTRNPSTIDYGWEVPPHHGGHGSWEYHRTEGLSRHEYWRVDDNIDYVDPLSHSTTWFTRAWFACPILGILAIT
jgi:hypothetical protein